MFYLALLSPEIDKDKGGERERGKRNRCAVDDDAVVAGASWRLLGWFVWFGTETGRIPESN